VSRAGVGEAGVGWGGASSTLCGWGGKIKFFGGGGGGGGGGYNIMLWEVMICDFIDGSKNIMYSVHIVDHFLIKNTILYVNCIQGPSWS
jgi:hypothetical protein